MMKLKKKRVNLPNLRNGSWDRDNLIGKKIETNYKTQFSINLVLKDEIKKKNWLRKDIKKWPESTRVNPSNLWPKSWDKDNFIEMFLKQIIKSNSQSTQYWRMKLRKNSIRKRKKLSQPIKSTTRVMSLG